jgi:hypothetical protein
LKTKCLIQVFKARQLYRKIGFSQSHLFRNWLGGIKIKSIVSATRGLVQGRIKSLGERDVIAGQNPHREKSENKGGIITFLYENRHEPKRFEGATL